MFANLKAEMSRKNITVMDLSKNKELDLSYEGLRNKFSKKTEWTNREMFVIKKQYFPNKSLDYLFKWTN